MHDNSRSMVLFNSLLYIYIFHFGFVEKKTGRILAANCTANRVEEEVPAAWAGPD